MSSTFSIALSGLQAESEAINTAGNNLANITTDGFKESLVDFKDLFSEQLGVSGSFDLGLGVSSPISNQLFTQGGIQTSASPTSAAVEGNGYFVVQNSSNQQLFTRDGNFILDSSGVLRTQTGETVQGWMATTSGINTNGATTDITVPNGTTLPAVASTQFSVNANLDASGVAGTTTGTFSQPITAIDSLGDSHILTINFDKSTTANTWTYQVTIPSADVTTGSPTTLASGTLSFNSNGVLIPTPPATTIPNPVIPITNLSDSASDMNFTWNLVDANGAGTITQYSQASTSGTPTVDGSAASQLNSVAIQTGGQVVASFSNGKTVVEAQLALASILNQDSLQNAGNNNFITTGASATPAIGIPQGAGRGQIVGGALETSNVDLATQLTNLIVYQSAYQANSRVITTEQTIEQDLLQLIH